MQKQEHGGRGNVKVVDGVFELDDQDSDSTQLQGIPKKPEGPDPTGAIFEGVRLLSTLIKLCTATALDRPACVCLCCEPSDVRSS